jgi:hypothetical protein
LIEVDQADLATAGTSKGCSSVRANATTANDDHEGVAEFGESFISQEDSISCQLFEDECFVVVAQTSAAGKGNASLVFFVESGFIYNGATKVVDL